MQDRKHPMHSGWMQPSLSGAFVRSAAVVGSMRWISSALLGIKDATYAHFPPFSARLLTPAGATSLVKFVSCRSVLSVLTNRFAALSGLASGSLAAAETVALPSILVAGAMRLIGSRRVGKACAAARTGRRKRIERWHIARTSWTVGRGHPAITCDSSAEWSKEHGLLTLLGRPRAFRKMYADAYGNSDLVHRARVRRRTSRQAHPATHPPRRCTERHPARSPVSGRARRPRHPRADPSRPRALLAGRNRRTLRRQSAHRHQRISGGAPTRTHRDDRRRDLGAAQCEHRAALRDLHNQCRRRKRPIQADTERH